MTGGGAGEVQSTEEEWYTFMVAFGRRSDKRSGKAAAQFQSGRHQSPRRRRHGQFLSRNSSEPESSRYERQISV
eukprot:3900842-Prymnesium_polylepis.1